MSQKLMQNETMNGRIPRETDRPKSKSPRVIPSGLDILKQNKKLHLATDGSMSNSHKITFSLLISISGFLTSASLFIISSDIPRREAGVFPTHYSMKSILPVQALGKKEGNLKISCFNEAQFVKRVCNFSYRQNSKCTLFELAIINFFNVGISDSYGDEVIAEEIS